MTAVAGLDDQWLRQSSIIFVKIRNTCFFALLWFTECVWAIALDSSTQLRLLNLSEGLIRRTSDRYGFADDVLN